MTINMEKAGGTTDLATLGVAYAVPRVNLLPPEVSAARTFRRVQVGLGGGVVAVVAAIVAAYVLSQQQASDAEEALLAEQARTLTLQTQQQQYAEVPAVLAAVDAAVAARETAMANDILWYRYLNDLALAYPAGVSLASLTASVASPTAPAAAATGTDPLATPGIGTIAFTGTALTTPDVANWLDMLASTPGLADAALSSASRTERSSTTVVDFTTQVVVTDGALSHRFDREAS